MFKMTGNSIKGTLLGSYLASRKNMVEDEAGQEEVDQIMEVYRSLIKRFDFVPKATGAMKEF